MEPNLNQKHTDGGTETPDTDIVQMIKDVPADFQLADENGLIISGWKIKTINPDTLQVTIENTAGKTLEFQSLTDLLDRIGKTKKYKRTLKANIEKIRMIPKTFEIVAKGIVYRDLIITRFNLDGKLVVTSKDGRLAWKPITVDALLEQLEKTKKWYDQKKADQIQAGLQQKKTLQIVEPEFARNETKRPPEEVPRSCEVMSIGDSHGNYGAFIQNLAALGVIDADEKWSGKNKKLVILGDIMADRNTGSLKIMKKIRELEKSAKAEKGSIILIAGNHEDFAISYLAGTTTCDGADPVFSYCMSFGQGLLELWSKYGEPSVKPDEGFAQALTKVSSAGHDLETFHQKILENMKKDPGGKKLLEQICDMKLAEQIDDTIYIHTDPADSILDALEKYGKTTGEAIDKINDIYRRGLRHQLLGEGKMPADFEEIRLAFLNTYNRTDGIYEPSRMRRLNEKGINYIIHGHSHINVEKSTVECGGVTIMGIDHSNGKSVDYNPGLDIGGYKVARSIAGIGRKGKPMDKLNFYN